METITKYIKPDFYSKNSYLKILMIEKALLKKEVKYSKFIFRNDKINKRKLN